MTEEKIKEGNKLIAEFMGARIEEKDNYFDAYDWRDSSVLVYSVPIDYLVTKEESKNIVECLLLNLYTGDWGQFHSDWNWLVSVVEKIELIEDDYDGRFIVYISSNNCTIQSTNFRLDKINVESPHYFSSLYGNSKIEAVWTAIIEFIKWYNSCKKK